MRLIALAILLFMLTPALAYAELAIAHPEDAALVAKALAKAVSGIHAATRIAESILGFSAAGDDSSKDQDIESVVRQSLDCQARTPDKIGIEVRNVSIPTQREIEMFWY